METIVAGERILVVDDGRENRDFIVQYILEPNGFESLVAKDGKEGLDMALKHRPDLILLDFQMPRLNGAQVLEHLAANQADIPVILMTFHGSEEVAIEVYRLGVRDYLKKPFSVEEMLMSINRALTEVRLRREKEALTERVIHANRELQGRIHELNVLYSVGKSVTATLDMDQLLPRIVDAATQVTQAEAGHIYLLSDGQLICRALKRQKDPRAKSANLEMNDRLAMQVVETGQSILLTPEQLTQPGAPVAVAYVPLVFNNQIMGVLGVSNVSKGTHVFAKHDSALLSTLTDYAAIAIENSRNFEALRQTKDDESAQIRGTFEKFVAPSVVNSVLGNPNGFELGGKRQEISVLFADIRGYTSWSENAPPEKVVEMLNDYLSLAAEIIMGWGGTLDKFMGDGLMAIFNAPSEQPDHVQRAADAALAMIRAAKEMAERRNDSLSYSVGVHVGDAVVGYIGTERAVNYTAIGDVVNVAKRLQENASAGQIFVSESVVQRLGGMAQARGLGELKIRNRQQKVGVHELSGLNPIV